MGEGRGGVVSVFDDAFIVEGARTPFVDYNGALSLVSPIDLGIKAGRAALERADVAPEAIDAVICGSMAQASFDAYMLPRHIGLYAFKADVLQQFATLQPSMLEEAESLEQLRLLEHGFRIQCVQTLFDTPGVNTPEELEQVRRIIRESASR